MKLMAVVARLFGFLWVSTFQLHGYAFGFQFWPSGFSRFFVPRLFTLKDKK
jgi:hypothetical protein